VAGFLARSRLGVGAALLVAAAAGLGVGLLVRHWSEGVAGGIGGIAGAVGAAAVVLGALRRGGTSGGTAAIVGLAGIGLAALAFIPGFGYFEALAVPLLGLRLRRRSGDRYAGLRILARD
jgi:hypothetical protein